MVRGRDSANQGAASGERAHEVSTVQLLMCVAGSWVGDPIAVPVSVFLKTYVPLKAAGRQQAGLAAAAAFDPESEGPVDLQQVPELLKCLAALGLEGKRPVVLLMADGKEARRMPGFMYLPFHVLRNSFTPNSAVLIQKKS